MIAHRFPVRLAALALVGLGLHGCGQSAGDNDTAPAATPGAAPVEDADAAQADIPSEFIRTAWRSIAEDGARYVTYLDEGGRYRDLRNGDPWQVGTWEADGADQMCFLPEAEGGVLRCWHPDRMEGRDAMIATSEDGKRIRLERADYSPPDEATAASDDGDTATAGAGADAAEGEGAE